MLQATMDRLNSYATAYPLIFFDGEKEHHRGALPVDASLNFKKFMDTLGAKVGCQPGLLNVAIMCSTQNGNGAVVRQQIPIHDNTNFGIILQQYNPSRDKSVHFLAALKTLDRSAQHRFKAPRHGKLKGKAGAMGSRVGSPDLAQQQAAQQHMLAQQRMQMLQVPMSRLMLQQPRHPMAPIPPGVLQPLFGRQPQVMPLGMMSQMANPLTPRGMGQLPLTPRQGFQGGVPPFGFAAPAPMASPRPGSSQPWAIPHLSRQQAAQATNIFIPALQLPPRDPSQTGPLSAPPAPSSHARGADFWSISPRDCVVRGLRRGPSPYGPIGTAAEL